MDLLQAAHLGLQRAAAAAARELLEIRQSRPREGYPHVSLLAALPEPEDLLEAADLFATELLAEATSHTPKALRNTTKQLASLHSAARKIRGTLEWSSEFTGIDWWVSRRVSDLGLEGKHVLVSPGALDQFHIERESRFAEYLKELGTGEGMLTDSEGVLLAHFDRSIEALSDYHILTVPASDGISPLWNPIFLGHEIAHLRYNESWVQDWLSNLGESASSDMLRQVEQDTKKTIEANSAGVRVRRSGWMGQLDCWLVEVACDTVALHFYDSSGQSAIRSFLSGLTDGHSSETHPSLDFRMAIQSADDVADLERFRPADPFADATSRATDCLLTTAIALREAVSMDLEYIDAVDRDISSAVSTSAVSALEAGLLPPSSEWPGKELPGRVGSIESGLVQALWVRMETPLGDPALQRQRLEFDVELVSQAIDGLEFASRFEERRAALSIESQDPTPLPNVLWVTPHGVKVSEGNEVGRSSADVRLGRYFIVFQRNEVSFLNSLGDRDGIPPIQRQVEVGWGEEFVLHPGELVLAVTFESLRVDADCMAQVLSRSSLGRLGLLSATAVQVNPGFIGCLTLELVNLASVPLRLTPGQRVAQVVPSLALGDTPVYDGLYQGAGRRPQFSLSGNDWEAAVLKSMGGHAV